MTQTLRVVQAFDRTLVAEVGADDGAALEKKLVAAAAAMRTAMDGSGRIRGVPCSSVPRVCWRFGKSRSSR